MYGNTKKDFAADDEAREWLYLTPAVRLLETAKLWQLYLSLGGRLDPEPDLQSPFYCRVSKILEHLFPRKSLSAMT